MEALKENLSELAIGNTAESVQAFLDSQRELIHGQIDQLQNIVVSQCKLTGVNPLSQEMAAGALSIKIGKRPRDLLNPKAVKYMQSVFSIKDAISKKESREISALFGVRVTQVRDFFTSQRTRVRKVVRLSRDKSIKPNACQEPQNGVPTIIYTMTTSDPVPLNNVSLTSLEEAPVPLNSVSLTSAAETHVPLNAVTLTCVEETPVPLSTFGPTSFEGTPVPLNTLGPASADEGPSCSTQDEALPGIDGPDKKFVQNIFCLMRKEETFSGQVKLMEWILQIQNSAVLNWFLSNGGVMILASWLSEADIEEQTSVLLFILKVLCHLPLHKALPMHMSAILQSVNRLRFYRIADISNRARILLSRWSKTFARSQAMKKPNGMQSSTDAQKDVLLKQSISEVMADESWQSKINTPEALFAPSFESSEYLRNLENPKTFKLLPAPSDDTSRKHNRDIRGRRKVLMVEQPGQKTAGRSSQVTRAVSASQGRPMSADDIQKAKLRAQFMQSKHGKIGPFNGVHVEKTVGSSKPMTNHAKVSLLASKVHLRPQIEEHRKPVPLPAKQLRVSIQPKQNLNPKELLLEKCKRVKIPWQTPPEFTINTQYGVCTGENSKEVEIQKIRNHREKETIYLKGQETPPNPKNPWDIEMDYDDSLTPEIPTEQPPDSDQPSSPEHENRATVSSEAVSPQANTSGGSGAPAPDLELLAVLLKNPELVFALTSGQAGNISSDDTVKLLDMIKSNGGGLLGNESRLDGEKKAEQRVDVSLPSPTPPSNPGTSGWIPNNPFLKRMATANTNIANPTTPAIEKFPPAALNHHQVSTPVTTTQRTPHYLPSQQFQSSTPPKRSLSINPPVYQNNPNSPILHSPTPSQEKSIPQPPLIHEALHMIPQYNRQVGNPPPSYDPSPWRGRQSLGSNFHSQVDQNSYNSTFGGPTLGQAARSLQRDPDPSRERDEYVGYDEYEYQNSRYNNAQENIPAWKHADSRMNIGQNIRPTYQDSSVYHDYGRNGERWTGNDHDRRR